MLERICASSRCNLIEKVLLKIARSGSDYRGAFNGNRRFAGVFRFAMFYIAFLREALMALFVLQFFRYYEYNN